MSEEEDGTIRDGDGPETIERKIGHRERARLERAARRHELGRPDLTELELGKRTYRVAEVEPLDVDGVRTMAVGCVLWAIATIALLPFLGRLADSGYDWWLWTCLAGLGLGLMGLEYCRRRRNALLVRETLGANPGRRRAR